MLYDPFTEKRYILDLHRQKMEAPGFIDFDYATKRYSGIMHEWQVRSASMGIPINAWIVEINAAQRFLLQQRIVKEWQMRTGTNIIPHQTTQRKSDPEFGIQMLAPHFKFGRYRLPGLSKELLDPMVQELTTWSSDHIGTEDTVMALWFCESHLPQLSSIMRVIPERWIPSWIHTTKVMN